METRLQKLILTTILAAFTVVGQGVLGSGGVTAPGPLPAKPNILFLFADDQRADTISAWGNENIRTPNLDRLVARGFSFRRNYCFGSNSGAVCVPSRAMLHSGRTWLHIDSKKLTGLKLLGELLGEHGYTTFGTGKWHNGEESYLRSFAMGKNVMFGGMSDHTRVPLHDIGPDHSPVNSHTGKEFSSKLFADATIEFLKNYSGDQPFFAYCAFTAPHDPRQPPLKYREYYYKNRPPLPDNFLPQHPFDNGWMTGRDEALAPWPRTREVVSDQLAEYYGLVTHLDEQIGRVLETLNETPHASDTLIIYAADHGLSVGSHGLLGKQSVYEHSMRCPLIFVGEGIPGGKNTEAFSYLFDIYPTLCDLTGIDPPAGLDGHSLRPIWEGNKKSVRDAIFLPFTNIMRSVRTDRWKLIQYPKINHTQLFDLEKDPGEMKNLAQVPEFAKRVQEMTALLKKWQAKVRDDQPLTSTKPKQKEIDLTGRKRKPDNWQPDWIVEKYFQD